MTNRNIVRLSAAAIAATVATTLPAVPPASAGPLVAGAATRTPAGRQHLSPFDCLARAIYFEARSEPLEGQAAVGRVILNRVDDGGFPATVCAVVYQGSSARNRCQFSFACDGLSDRIREAAAWRTAQDVARRALACRAGCRTGGLGDRTIGKATHFHTTDVAPGWSAQFRKAGRIGRHIFYAPWRG